MKKVSIAAFIFSMWMPFFSEASSLELPQPAQDIVQKTLRAQCDPHSLNGAKIESIRKWNETVAPGWEDTYYSATYGIYYPQFTVIEILIAERVVPGGTSIFELVSFSSADKSICKSL